MFKCPERDLLKAPPIVHEYKRYPPQQRSSACRVLAALTSGQLECTYIWEDVVVWLWFYCLNDAQQDAVMYIAQFFLVLLTGCPSYASVDQGVDT